MSTVSLVALLGGLGALFSAVALGIVRLRQSAALIEQSKMLLKQSEVNRLQDVINGLCRSLDFWQERYEKLQTRVHTLEQARLEDSEENSKLQTEIETLKREQQARNDAWEKERGSWRAERRAWEKERAELKQHIETLIAEREDLLVRLTTLEKRFGSEAGAAA